LDLIPCLVLDPKITFKVGIHLPVCLNRFGLFQKQVYKIILTDYVLLQARDQLLPKKNGNQWPLARPEPTPQHRRKPQKLERWMFAGKEFRSTQRSSVRDSCA